MDRRAGRGGDVDAVVHPSPAHAERARHRPDHGPDEACGRRRASAGRAGRRLCRLNPRRKLRAHRLQRVDLARLIALRRRQRRQRLLPSGLRPRECVPACDEPIPEGASLGRAQRDDAQLLAMPLARRSGLEALNAHPLLRGGDCMGDPVVTARDALEIVDPVEHLGDALRREQQRQRVRDRPTRTAGRGDRLGAARRGRADDAGPGVVSSAGRR